MNTNIQGPKSKNKSQFAALPEADRKLILNLCAAHPYEEAAVLLRKPRAEGGLDIHTSASALCRYFTSHNPDPDRAVLGQIAAATNIRHEQDANAFLGAIRATVEARVLENLRSGRALADMDKDFKLLRTAESLYLADANFRAKHPKAARAAYQNLVQRCADAPDTDFLPNDQADPSQSHPDNPDQPTPSIEFNDLTDLDLDILKARQRRQETLAILAKSGVQPEPTTNLHDINPAFLSMLAPKSRPAQNPNIPPTTPSKTPAIPHIPPDSTKNRTASAPKNQPLPADQPKPTPHIAPPKINRNDSCHCGSRRKAKKCCHR